MAMTVAFELTFIEAALVICDPLCLKGIKVRDQLRDLTEKEYWVYGITETDFDYAVDLVREMIDARTEQYEKEAAKGELRGRS